MKIDITSMFFNSSVNGTATAAWRTSIGQNNKKKCKIETEVPGVTDVVIGILHLLKDDFPSKSYMTRGGNNDEVLVSSVFDKVYINGIYLENCKYVLSIVREHTASHDGRKELCYSPNLCYGDISNSNAIKQMANALGCTENGCWFVYDLSVINQDELHFSAVVVNHTSPANYNFGGAERSKIWNALVADEVRTNNAKKNGANDSYSPNEIPLQQIFYGAPGTGKSHTIDEKTNESNRIRTTFHPDYDYATFVGAYKPTVKTVDKYGLFGKDTVAMKHEDNTPITEDVIVYKFIPQTFIKAYVEAWRRYTNAERTDKDFYLVIEEINRGNCAQIFGDLFQLLDRTNAGFSSYAVETDTDLQTFLTTDEEYKLDIVLTEDIKNDNGKVIATVENVMTGKVLVLPPNLHIWATMNTSDQSLFPIDSAFKRRWDWKYVPISDAGKKYKIEVNKTDKDTGEKKLMRYDWWQFLEKVNEAIDSATSSEDKKLGYFFCKAEITIDSNPEPTVITADRFVSKVLFYLYNDVFKDYDVDDAKFTFEDEDLSLLTYTEKEIEKKFRFPMFFNAKGDANEDMVVKFLENLKIEGEEVENSGSNKDAIADNFHGQTDS